MRAQTSCITLFVSAVLLISSILASKTPGRARLPTPPMGWSTWVTYGKTVTEKGVLANAAMLKSSGLQSAGYNLIQIDDGWMQLNLITGWISRDNYPNQTSNKFGPNGQPGFASEPQVGCMVHDPVKFPNGFDFLPGLKTKGFRIGLYTSGEVTVCAPDDKYTGVYASAGYMNLRGIDAECFTKWGADILKVDSCRPPSSSAKYAQGVMSAWRGLLPQNISVYNSRYGCLAKTTCGGVYKCPLDTNIKANRHIQGYCSATADVARLGPDMEPHWPNIIAGLSTRLGRGRIARPGFWVDPDFLVPNLTTLTYQETRVQFSAWCITSSPLLISVDLTQTSSEIFDMLSNKDAIRINQQYFSTGGDLWYMWGVIWVLRKQISATELAVLIINVDSTYRRNAGPKKGTVRYTFPTLAGLTAVESSGPVQSCSAKNIWENTTFTLTKATIFPIEPRDCVFLLVSNCQ